MCKGRRGIKMSSMGMVKAPWVYISDPSSESVYSQTLTSRIHNDARHIVIQRPMRVPNNSGLLIVSDPKQDDETDAKVAAASEYKDTATKRGRNFASINIMKDITLAPKTNVFGTNHLNIAAGPDCVDQIIRFLFEVLTIRETLHLISAEDMKKCDDKSFKDYAYCPINECKRRPRDAKIQFVAVVLTKAEVAPCGNKLTWQVADRTGVANFYFQHRGQLSQNTWDWVLSLNPGQKVTLPRMPMIQVKEKMVIRIVKAPFRGCGSVIKGTGFVIKAVGKGVTKVGKVMSMGSSSEWVAEADIGPDGKKIDRNKKTNEECKSSENKSNKFAGEPKVEKAKDKDEKNWSDGASDASTDIGDDLDEKVGKEFI